MSDRQLYCDGPGQQLGDECGRPVAGHGLGLCSSHLKQKQRTGKCVPIAEKLNLEERAIELGTKMLEADGDEEYEERRRSFLAACKSLGAKPGQMVEVVTLADEARRRRSIEVKAGLAAARARGLVLGRPPKATPPVIKQFFERLKSARLVAQALELSVRTVTRHLRSGQKPNVFVQPSNGPRTPRKSP